MPRDGAGGAQRGDGFAQHLLCLDEPAARVQQVAELDHRTDRVAGGRAASCAQAARRFQKAGLGLVVATRVVLTEPERGERIGSLQAVRPVEIAPQFEGALDGFDGRAVLTKCVVDVSDLEQQARLACRFALQFRLHERSGVVHVMARGRRWRDRGDVAI